MNKTCMALFLLLIAGLTYALPPVTVNKTINIPNAPTEISAELILAGDIDPEGTDLYITIFDEIRGGETNWTWEISVWDSVLFTPDGFSTEGGFTYIVFDQDGENTWGTVDLVFDGDIVTPSPTPEPTAIVTPTTTPSITPSPTNIPLPTVLPCLSDDKSIYFFAHSLIDHHSSANTMATRMPYWLKQVSSRDFTADGQFGFIHSHVTPFNPTDQLGWEGVTTNWQGDFHSSGYTTVFITPRNFAQNVEPSHQYEDGTEGSPLTDSVELIRQSGSDKEFILYASWPDMGNFGFPNTDLTSYYNYSSGDFYQWFVQLRDEILLQEPTANIRIAPVGYMLARLLTETNLSALDVLDLYEDDAPHGTPTLYFLAAMITHVYLYGESPDIGANIVSDEVHPLVLENYGNILNYLMINKL